MRRRSTNFAGVVFISLVKTRAKFRGLIAARCAEGIGSEEFTRILLEHEDLEAFVARTHEEGFFIPDQWEAHELLKACRKAEVLCYTEGIDAATLERCFVTPVPSVEAGLEHAFARHGSNARLAVIPQGPYVVPVLAEPNGHKEES